MRREKNMKKYVSILLVLMLVNISLLMINPNEVKADDNNQLTNVDVIIVIDNSGSMDQITNNTTRWEDAVEAATEFIDNLKDGDRCAIFAFGSNANYSYYSDDNEWGSDKPRKIIDFTTTTVSGKNTLKDNLSSLDPYFYTPIFDTIGASMDYMVDYKRSDSVGAIVVLTDGEDNICYQFYPSHSYKEKNDVTKPYEYYGDYWGSNSWRYGLLNFTEATFIIGLDIEQIGDYKVNQFKDIANSSDGQYFSAATSAELGAIYDVIAQQIDEKRDDKGSDDKESSFLDQWLIPLIIIIIAVIVVSILLAVLLKKKKTPPYAQKPMGAYQQPQAQQQTQQPSSGFCPTCGKPTRFIQQYNRYWCDSCQKYK